jgi:serine/threonine protein kinase
VPDPLLGSRVGPYRIVMLLGEGGMGAVYLAERDDKQFHKQVAIKVLKRGADGHDALRRFQLEREVLAALDHPSIVRLLDAGVTATGIPCVIMDYVEGVTIDKYCSTAKPSLTERLRLFVEICSAVHYAHQRLVVHCDIKPANILVANDGRPKLLDFGIGKLLRGDEAQVRATGSETAGPLTPDHASPEQLLGLPVTTSTDIYALGLTLYEILVGQ